VIGGLLIPGEAGATCRIRAEKAEDANYLTQSSVDMLIAIKPIEQEPLKIANINTVSVGDIELIVAGGSGTGEIVFVAFDESGTTADEPQCSIVQLGTPVRKFLRASKSVKCVVYAKKLESPNFNEARSPDVTFTFTKSSQAVNFTTAVPGTPTRGGFYFPGASASSGLPVTITITEGDRTACEFDSEMPNRINFVAPANSEDATSICKLTASQAGNEIFAAASAQQTIVIGNRHQKIDFRLLSNDLDPVSGERLPLTELRFGSPTFQLNATASSGLAVIYSVPIDDRDARCRVDEGRVTLLRAGSCTIVASQPGNGTYEKASDVTQIFTVLPDRAGAPHLLSVSVSNSAIVAKFRAPSYLGGSQISSYRMEATKPGINDGEEDRYTNPGCQPTGQEVVCELVGMPLNHAYTVRIAAVTAAGVGVFSQPSLPVTPGQTDIAVSMLAGTRDYVEGEIAISWQEPSSVDATSWQYQVFVWPLNTDRPEEPNAVLEGDSGVDGTTIFVGTAPQQQIQLFRAAQTRPTVDEADSYHLMVVTVTKDADKPLNDINVASGLQLGLGVPDRPRNSLLTVGSEGLLAAWSTPEFDGGDEILHYTVEVNEGEPQTVSLDSRLFELTDLTAGTTYEIAIYAHNNRGRSEPAILTHSIPAPPPPPAPAPAPAPAAPAAPDENAPGGRDNATRPTTPAPDSTSRPRPTPSPSELLNDGDSADAPVDQGDDGTVPTPGPTSGTGGSGSGTGSDSGATDGSSDTDRDQSQAAGGDVQDQGALQLMLWLLVGLALTLLLRRFALRNQQRLES
jgi:hypothetical protein